MGDESMSLSLGNEDDSKLGAAEEDKDGEAAGESNKYVRNVLLVLDSIIEGWSGLFSREEK